MANIKASDIGGLFVRKDDRGRTVYSSPILKKSYLINNAEARTFFLWQNRSFACIMIGFFIALLDRERYILGILVGLGLYAVSTAIFYLTYVTKLPEVRGDKVEKRGYIDSLAEEYSAKRLLLLALLCLLFEGACYANIRLNGFTGLNLIGNIILMIAVFVFMAVCVTAYSRKKKQ